MTEIRFSVGGEVTVYDDDGDEIDAPTWLVHARATGHSSLFRQGDPVTCADCTWPLPPPNPFEDGRLYERQRILEGFRALDPRDQSLLIPKSLVINVIKGER